MDQDINVNALRINLTDYINVLIGNYQCETKKRPSVLVELSQEMFRLDSMLASFELESSDNELKNKLDNILKFLKKSGIEERELNLLKNSISKEWHNSKKEEIKKVEDKLKYVMKLTEKAVKKIPELKRDSFSIHEDNTFGINESREQSLRRWGVINSGKPFFYSLYKDSNTRETVDFDKGMKIYFTILQQKINKFEFSRSSNEEINFTDTMSEEKKIIDEYEKMVSQGKIEKSNNKPLTFFAKIGFQPLKKQISEKEIIEKLSQTGYVLDLLRYAKDAIKENKGKVDFSNTLDELDNLIKKYSAVSNRLRDDLENSNYEEMKQAVEKQKEMQHQLEKDKLNRQKVKLLYKKILKSDNDEEIKKLLEEIRFVELPANEKEIEKNNAAIEYETEIENKKIEQKIIQEEYKKEQEYKAEVANGLRQRAIQELEMENAFASDYYESGMDVKDNMTSDKKEDLIQRKMAELKSQDKITKQEQALQDLKDLGYIKREDVTLSNLKPYERDALLAQMRINAREEQEQKTGYNK